MIRTLLFAVLLASFPAAAPVLAQQEQGRTSLADFSWLEGRWESDLDGRPIEVHWSRPRAGAMIGMFRILEGERTLMVEASTLVERPEGLTLFFRHFSPELVPWEKEAAIRLELASYDGQRAEFVNPVHTQPKLSILERIHSDTFRVRSEIVRADGSESTIDVTWRRAARPLALPAASGRTLEKELVVRATLEDVWRVFTSADGVRAWAGGPARIELRVGGPFEVYCRPDAPPGQRGMEGTRILSYVPLEMLSYTGSPEPTWVVWRFADLGDSRVRIRFTGLGWGEGPEWEREYVQFDAGMDLVLRRVEAIINAPAAAAEAQRD